jgi:NACalpha-BTF3-like transcription factor
MSLTGCTQEQAEKALRECNNDTVDAVDKILNIPPSKFIPKKKELDDTQKKFAEMRANMESMDRLNDTKLMKKDQPDCSSSPKLMRTLSLHQEELSSDLSHTQQSQIVIPELEEQKPETVCPSQSE